MIVQGGLVIEPDAPHLGGFVPDGDPGSWCPEVWKALLGDWHVGTVIDLGCGHGKVSEWFAARTGWDDESYRVIAVDGSQEACRLTAERSEATVIRHDFATGPLDIRARRSLCWSAEFVEHVEERFAENFLALMARCDVVAMTHALPGQSGHHHVNCQPREYWLEKLEARGMRYQPELSERLRNMTAANYVRASLLVFTGGAID